VLISESSATPLALDQVVDESRLWNGHDEEKDADERNWR
jgi:hypothetical protein